MNQEAQSKEVENDEKEPVANETEEWREIKEWKLRWTSGVEEEWG